MKLTQTTSTDVTTNIPTISDLPRQKKITTHKAVPDLSDCDIRLTSTVVHGGISGGSGGKVKITRSLGNTMGCGQPNWNIQLLCLQEIRTFVSQIFRKAVWFATSPMKL